MIAITMARNEEDIIGKTVAHLMTQGVDVVYVADNLSTDWTASVAEIAGAIVVPDRDPAYRQSAKMTRLAERFAHEGEWVIPFDADEYWSGLAKLESADCDIAPAAPHVHVHGDRRALMNEPQPKVAFRWRPGATISLGNHWVEGAGDRITYGLINVCHHQYRTLEQVKRKVCDGTRALDLAGFEKDSYGAHWRELAALDDEALEAWWATYTNQPTVACPLSVQ